VAAISSLSCAEIVLDASELCHLVDSGVDVTTYFLTPLMKSANGE